MAGSRWKAVQVKGKNAMMSRKVVAGQSGSSRHSMSTKAQAVGGYVPGTYIPHIREARYLRRRGVPHIPTIPQSKQAQFRRQRLASILVQQVARSRISASCDFN